MPDDDAFLRAIGAAPADDAPRLVYADWLDEHGRPERAEFIRVQCELARPGAERMWRTELRLRERELLKAHESDWAKPFRGCEAWEFRRGFVERIAGEVGGLGSLAADLFAPGVVKEVRVTGPLHAVPGVYRLRQMCGLRVLRLSSLAIRGTDVNLLGDANQFHDLAVLDLRWNDLTAGVSTRLVDRLNRPDRTLLLGGNHFGPEGRAVLSEVLGDRVSFAVERPAEHLYHVRPDSNRITGIDTDHRQVVICYTGRSRLRLFAFCFDLDGDLIAAEEYPKPARARFPIGDDPVARLFASRFGLVPQPVSVQKFHHAQTGVGIADFTEAHWDLIHDPPAHPNPADFIGEIRADAYRRLKYQWVPNGDFVFGEIPG